MYSLSVAKINQLRMCGNRGLRLSAQEEEILAQIRDGSAEDDPVAFVQGHYITRTITPSKPVRLLEMRNALSTKFRTAVLPMEAEDGSHTCVLFVGSASAATLGKNAVEVALATATKLNCNTCIIVSDRGYSFDASKAVSESHLLVDFFLMSSLQFNLPDHKMVPRHERCTEEEKRALYLEAGTSALRLPILSTVDPVAIYYGWRSGTLVRITRDYSLLDMPAATSISYRIVI